MRARIAIRLDSFPVREADGWVSLVTFHLSAGGKRTLGKGRRISMNGTEGKAVQTSHAKLAAPHAEAAGFAAVLFSGSTGFDGSARGTRNERGRCERRVSGFRSRDLSLAWYRAHSEYRIPWL